MASRGETRTRILDAAAELFRRRGYHGTGLNQVLAASGAPRGSLYHHFPGGKQQIAVSAVGSAGHAIGRGIEHLLAGSEDVGEAVAAAVAFVAADLRDSSWERGCPVGTVAMDAALTSEPVRAACSQILGEWVSAIEGRLADTGRDADESRELALLAVSALEGALMIARAQRDTEPLDAVTRRLRVVLRPLTASRAPQGRPQNRRTQ